MRSLPDTDLETMNKDNKVISCFLLSYYFLRAVSEGSIRLSCSLNSTLCWATHGKKMFAICAQNLKQTNKNQKLKIDVLGPEEPQHVNFRLSCVSKGAPVNVCETAMTCS